MDEHHGSGRVLTVGGNSASLAVDVDRSLLDDPSLRVYELRKDWVAHSSADVSTTILGHEWTES